MQFICDNPECKASDFHSNHTCYQKDTVQSMINFMTEVELEHSYFCQMFKELQNIFDKSKAILEKRINADKETVGKILNQQLEQKLFTNFVERRQAEVCFKFISVEIIRKIVQLNDLLKQILREEQNSKSHMKIRVSCRPSPIQQSLIEEEKLPTIQVSAKLKQITFVGSQTERVIKSLKYMSNNQYLIHFESGSLVNYNIIQKCAMQQAISCYQYDFQYPQLLVYNNTYTLYQYNRDTRQLQLIAENLPLNAEWFQLYNNEIIIQQFDHHFYRYTHSNMIKIYQMVLPSQTINLILKNYLAIIQNQQLWLYDMSSSMQNNQPLTFDSRINQLKSQSDRYLICIGDCKYTIVDVLRRCIRRVVETSMSPWFVEPNPDVPYLFVLVVGQYLKESKVYLYDTKQIFQDLTNQCPTAISMEKSNLLIADDLGYIQVYELKV